MYHLRHHRQRNLSLWGRLAPGQWRHPTCPCRKKMASVAHHPWHPWQLKKGRFGARWIWIWDFFSWRTKMVGFWVPAEHQFFSRFFRLFLHFGSISGVLFFFFHPLCLRWIFFEKTGGSGNRGEPFAAGFPGRSINLEIHRILRFGGWSNAMFDGCCYWNCQFGMVIHCNFCFDISCFQKQFFVLGSCKGGWHSFRLILLIQKIRLYPSNQHIKTSRKLYRYKMWANHASW